MKLTLLLLFVCPLQLWAQADSVQTLRREDLKLIESELQPAYYGRYGTTVRSQYMYDGLDIKAKQLAPYIMASGEPTAIQEFNKYISNRHTGGWLIAGGITAMLVGTIVGTSNSPVNVQKPIICPTGMVCYGTSSGSSGPVYAGGIVGYQNGVDSQREAAVSAGLLTALTGCILTGIGWGLYTPGKHVRKAVQFYNRALKQRQGISWQLQPYSSYSSAGVGLAGRF
ncbi:hypothetical protein [Fibrella rubiginis]|nr:hypothetical protein [Fibrella rubiginis]